MQRRSATKALPAILVALGLSTAAAGQTLFEEAFELDNLGHSLGITVTLPEGWETGRMFGNLALSHAPPDRAGVVVLFFRADSSDLRNLLSDSTLDGFWHQRSPIERSEARFAGHPVTVLHTGRPGRAGSYDPVSQRRHDGERLLLVFDTCVGMPNRPVALQIATAIDEPALGTDPLVAELMSGIELTLPTPQVPCDPGLLDGLQTVAGEIDLSAWSQ